MPIAHKDIFVTRDLPTTAGSRMLAGYRSPFDATVVARLGEAGTVTLGKLNCDEFAMGSSNENSAWKVVRNPWDESRVPGGSSGGSAAAVAARLLPAATGTDTGGSIRQPASFCGITGIKPTYGVCSRYGMIAFASSLDQAGPLARSAEDCALLLSAMSGFDARDATSAERPPQDYPAALARAREGATAARPLHGLRIGLAKEFFPAGLAGDVEKALRSALAELERLGATLVDVSLPRTELAIPVYYLIAPAEASSNLSRFDGVRYGHRAEHYEDLQGMYKASRSEGFGPEVKRRIMIGTYVLSHGYYDAYYLQAQKLRRMIADDFQACFRQCDLIAGPVAPTVAWKLGAQSDDPVANYLADIFTLPASLAGLPGMSVPAGFGAGGMPVGLQLIGNYFDEGTLLHAAHAFQQATDWHQRAPAASASRGGARHERAALIRGYEVVIGIETHAQLSTRSKIFSGASTAFGAAPNTQASAVDLALPGTLPVANRGAVERAIRFGLAVGATVAPLSIFARKNYFYPDLPKGYQISQYETPVVQGGTVEFFVGEVGASRQPDPRPPRGGRRQVDPRHRPQRRTRPAAARRATTRGDWTGVDLNRAGTPLLEIVTEPDMRSSVEAVEYAKALHALVVWLDICDGNMQEGSFRCDANVSVRRPGAPFGTRREIKNLNSFRFMQQAIDYEVQWQIDLLEDGGQVQQATVLFDPEHGETRAMRSKEDAHDYRYFPDPDLPPLAISEAWIAAVRATMPELPREMAARFQRDYALAEYDARIVTQSKEFAAYFESAARASGQPKLVANWMMGEISRRMNAAALSSIPLPAAQLAALVGRIADNTISNNAARQVFDALWQGEGSDVDAIIEARGLRQMRDAGELERVVEAVIAANPKSVEEFRAGKEKAFNALVGQAMKATQGKADPTQLNALLRAKLGVELQ